jgi:hypothetical protein
LLFFASASDKNYVSDKATNSPITSYSTQGIVKLLRWGVQFLAVFALLLQFLIWPSIYSVSSHLQKFIMTSSGSTYNYGEDHANQWIR